MPPAAIWGITTSWTIGLLLGNRIPLLSIWFLLLISALLILAPRVPVRVKRLGLILLCFLAAYPSSRNLQASSPWIDTSHLKDEHEGLRNPHYRPLVSITRDASGEKTPDEQVTILSDRPDWASEPVWRLIEGILLNRREAVDPTWVDAFRSAGAAHLLAVSGLHISILVMTIMILFSILRTGRRVSVVLAVLVLWFYVITIGAPPSAIRAGLMITAWILLRDTLRLTDDGRLFPVAILTALVVSPALIGSTGFQLSVAAVAGIILANRSAPVQKENSTGKRLRDIVRVTVGAQSGVLPLQVLVFGTITPLALLVNILAVPILGIWMPSILAALALGSIGGVPEQLAGTFCEGTGRVLLWWIYLCSRIPGIMQPAQPWTSLAAITALIAWARGRTRGRLFALLLLALVMWSPVLTPDAPRIAFLDVGQGDSIVIETRHRPRVIVIDAGPAWEDWNAGESVVAAYLRSRGINTIDLLIASHSDADHIGGMQALLDRFNVRLFMRGEWMLQGEGAAQRLLSQLVETQTRILLPHSGARIELARNTWLEVLRGIPGDADDSAAWKENDRSLVLRLDMDGLSVLLPGDLEISGERLLLPLGDRLRSEVLKVSHHGSGDSTSPEFLEIVQPSRAIISVGKRNRHGHPDPRVIGELRSSGTAIWRTDLSGALILRPPL
ncbi:DNA internalization-related competence protein ComEC/Rec2 [Candidatus Zixiibacteriota bacterium]